MATMLKKPVRRESSGLIREAGKVRPIIVSIEPPFLLGFRAKGCRKTYSLTAECCYMLAVKADMLDKRKQKAKDKKKKQKRGKPSRLNY